MGLGSVLFSFFLSCFNFLKLCEGTKPEKGEVARPGPPLSAGLGPARRQQSGQRLPAKREGARVSGTRPAPASCHLTRGRPRRAKSRRLPEAHSEAGGAGWGRGSRRPGPGEEAARVLGTASETRLGAPPPATPPSRRPARPALPGPRGPQPPCRTLPPARAPGKPAPRRQRARPPSPGAAEPPHSQP